MSPPLLQVSGLGKRFRGLEALRALTFEVRSGEILAVIGPNGAGKTTLLNIVSGALAPSTGDVHFRGKRISGSAPHVLSQAGIGRTFQSLELFPHLTVRENVMAGGVARSGATMLACLAGMGKARRLHREVTALADGHLRTVGLEGRALEPAGGLPAGSQRHLAVARALATGGDLMLLDEPGAGLNFVEKAELARVILQLRLQGKTIVFVEHDMSLVSRLADRVIVLDHGELIAAGSPEEVRENPRVIEAYLGVVDRLPRVVAPPPSRDGTRPALAVREIAVTYGKIRALDGVSLEVRSGEIVALIGSNGAGKSTLLKAVSGIVPAVGGTIEVDGQPITGWRAEDVVAAGISHVPEGRELFPSLTVWDNLVLGRYARFFAGVNLAAGVMRRRRGRRDTSRLVDQVFALFPVLSDRRHQLAGTLSGGEGQMLAIGRALMSSPRLLMLDEPSLGLAPRVVTEIMTRLDQLRTEGLTILLVEQNARAALAIADRGYVLDAGSVVATGSGAQLLNNPEVGRAYLGRSPDPVGPGDTSV
jgi:branched-chain amino acid transport system ATP-binding protein